MTYWHMDELDGVPAVTLCEDHALQGTNMAMALTGDEGFGSMPEAVAVFEAMFAAAGIEDPAPIVAHEGPCDQCVEDAKALEESA